ncbi:hypothetical protein A3D88_01920 [Candidatus Peribacteria bacterium RIFCSPHIGHO2_02_FULL_52_16]|nr:MAG: hypothetical protein A2706_05115 [Candidatus Peribacteria bacterium RIFCSPHIGHO2_01_FULL_51_35]OGJ61143.1 MAG: hypothetical protein A3D88_01920 [Candidatus Peribacteria bacterium RIFCSPHIGHO2_02_FULL_52_16]
MSKRKKKEKPKRDFGVADPRHFFCDRAFIIQSKEHFLFAFQTGSVVEGQYVFTPTHAKRLMLRLQEKIAKWEEENGAAIEAELPTEE